MNRCLFPFPSHLPNSRTQGRGIAPADLPYLQTLGKLIIWNSAGLELLNMPNLHKLSLKNYTDSWESIVTLIAKLGCLVSLEITRWQGLPLSIIDTRAFPSYEFLRTLLEGKWQLEGVTLNVDMFPPHLTELTLSRSSFDQDPMPMLEKLQCLKVFVIQFSEYKGKQMICSRGGFHQLIIKGCEMMKMVPDLQHVPTLNDLELYAMPTEFELRLRNEDQHKIKHIPSITFKGSY